MVILPETGTETTIPSDRTFEKSSTMHTGNWCDLSFHLVPVSQSDIEKCSVNEPQRRSVVSTACWIAYPFGVPNLGTYSYQSRPRVVTQGISPKGN